VGTVPATPAAPGFIEIRGLTRSAAWLILVIAIVVIVLALIF
jgi:hypothetical protein